MTHMNWPEPMPYHHRVRPAGTASRSRANVAAGEVHARTIRGLRTEASGSLQSAESNAAVHTNLAASPGPISASGETVSLTRRHPMAARPAWLMLLYLVGLVYGSLMPWQIDLASAARASGGYVGLYFDLLMSSAQWTRKPLGFSSQGIPHWLSDVVLNVALYLPLGVLLAWTLRRRRVSPSTAMLSVCAASLWLSWSLEGLQTLIPGRIASLRDIFPNLAGAVIGALLAEPMIDLTRRVIRAQASAIRHIWQSIEAMFDAHPLRGWTHTITLSLCLAGWVLASVWSSPISHPHERTLPFAHIFDRSYDVAWLHLARLSGLYCVMAMLMALQWLSASQRRRLGWVVLVVAAQVAAVQAIHLITGRSRPDLTSPILATMAPLIMFFILSILARSIRCARAGRSEHTAGHRRAHRNRRCVTRNDRMSAR